MVKVYSLDKLNPNEDLPPWMLVRSRSFTIAIRLSSRYKRWLHKVNPNSQKRYFKVKDPYREICKHKL